jgi:hypothetical protein
MRGPVGNLEDAPARNGLASARDTNEVLDCGGAADDAHSASDSDA